jgi:hypothetical protein
MSHPRIVVDIVRVPPMKVERALLISVLALAVPAAAYAEMPQTAKSQTAKSRTAKPQAAKPRAAKPQAPRQQTVQNGPASEAPAAGGPRVHVSKSRDVTDCTARTQGGPRTVTGTGLGALVGSRIGRGSTGVLVGSAAGNVVGDALDRKARCGPSAQIENNAAPAEAPKKKKKLSLGRILGQ